MDPLSGQIPLMERDNPALMTSINSQFSHQTIPPQFSDMYRLGYPSSSKYTGARARVCVCLQIDLPYYFMQKRIDR